MNPHEGEVRDQVEAALLRVCSSLLTDNVGVSPVNKEGTLCDVLVQVCVSPLVLLFRIESTGLTAGRRSRLHCNIVLAVNLDQLCAAVAIQVATLAYFRNLGSSPRDMSAPAMEELRAACDRVISAAYEFPEKQLRDNLAARRRT